MNTIQLNFEVGNLAFLRKQLEAQQAAVSSIQQRIAETDIGRELATALEELAKIRKEVEAKDVEVRDLAVKVYIETGSKAPVENVGIRVSKGNLRIVDQEEALHWALKNMPVAVRQVVDEKALIGWVELQDFEPIWVVRDPDKITATIAKKLK